MVRMINPFSRRKPASVLDLSFDDYDKESKLPFTIRVGNDHLEPLTEDFPTRCYAYARAYDSWAGGLTTERSRYGQLPSLGVLMCWHAYMLNPLIYARDVKVAYPAQEGLPFPLQEVAEAIRRGTLSLEPLSAPVVSKRVDDQGDGVWTPKDIAEAVQRQAKFIDKMDRIGYLTMVEEKQLREVQVSIVLYHAWLDLMHSTGSKYFLVPRLDIDLAWHTHQLHGSGYRADTLKSLGKVLDHNDDAGDGKLGDGLKTTARLWKERFGYDYQ